MKAARPKLDLYPEEKIERVFPSETCASLRLPMVVIQRKAGLEPLSGVLVSATEWQVPAGR